MYAKNTQNYREYPVAPATVYLNDSDTDRSKQAKGGGALNSSWLGAPTHRTATTRMAMGVVGWCVRVSVRACVHACAHACVRDVFAINDNNILPRLIMRIVKISFLYFIEIAHTDDFPSTGTRLKYHRCKKISFM